MIRFSVERSTMGGFLSGLIESSVHPADVKDANTGKYILYNSALANVFGVSNMDFRGQTVREVAPKGNNVRGKFLRDIERIEYEVKWSKQSVVKKNIISAHTQKILISTVVKTPIIGQQGTVIALLTRSHSILDHCDLFYLFSLYTQFYQKKQAIQYFLASLKIEHYFVIMPTYRETLSLLAMYYDTASKRVSKLLDIHPRTVEVYKRSLQDKMREISLHEVIIMMRRDSRYIDS